MPAIKEIVPDDFRIQIEKEMATVSPEDHKIWSVRRHNSLALFEKVFPSYHAWKVRMDCEIEEAIVNWAIKAMEIRRLSLEFGSEDHKNKIHKMNMEQHEVFLKYREHLHLVGGPK